MIGPFGDKVSLQGGLKGREPYVKTRLTEQPGQTDECLLDI